jgi:hypothetical protein
MLCRGATATATQQMDAHAGSSNLLPDLPDGTAAGRTQVTPDLPALLQTRFGVRTSTLAAVHEARVAGNGHSEWGLMQPARVKGQGFIVQELPLPLVSSPSAGERLGLGLRSCPASCDAPGRLRLSS